MTGHHYLIPPRTVRVSPWVGVVALGGVTLSALVAFVTVWSASWATRVVGICVLVLIWIVVSAFAVMGVLVLDRRGYRRLLLRRRPWSTVGRISVTDAPLWGPGASMLVVHARRSDAVWPLYGFVSVGAFVDLALLRTQFEAYRNAAATVVVPPGSEVTDRSRSSV